MIGTLPVDSLGAVGVIQDRPGHELPPEAWTDILNMRLKNGDAKRFAGHSQALGTLQTVPQFIYNVPSGNTSFWLYLGLAKAWVEDGGVHTEITNESADYTTVAGRDWVATTLAGIPVFTNNIDPPQYWAALSSGQVLQDLANWPSSTLAKVIRAFGSYLIALNITKDGTNSPHMVKTSHKASPGALPSSWDDTDATVDAVEFELTDAKAGEILDGLPLGSQFIVYKRHSTHVMRFAGGDDVWARDLLFENHGILATRCVCVIDDGTKHFVVTQSDIRVHQGTKASQSVVEKKVRAALFAEIDNTNYQNSFVFDNNKEREAWFCYPTSGNEIPNKALVYNYDDGTITYRDFNGLNADLGVLAASSTDTWDSSVGSWDDDVGPWNTAGREAIVFVDPTAGEAYKLDDGFTFDGSSPLAYLERTGLAIVGKDRQGNPKVDFHSRKLATRLWPKVTGSGRVDVRVGGQEFRDGAITWGSTKSFDPTSGAKYVDLGGEDGSMPNGRLLAVRFEFPDTNPVKIEGYLLEMSILGVN